MLQVATWESASIQSAALASFILLEKLLCCLSLECQFLSFSSFITKKIH